MSNEISIRMKADWYSIFPRTFNRDYCTIIFYDENYKTRIIIDMDNLEHFYESIGKYVKEKNLKRNKRMVK